MLYLDRKLSEETGTLPNGEVSLCFEQRAKSRLRAALEDGRDVAIEMARGSMLLPGDLLGNSTGDVIKVLAAREKLSRVTTDDSHRLARACYHLGNRHVALEITPTTLYYLHDHVLDEMVRLLGLETDTVFAGFQPEPGAYRSAHAGHHHD